MSASSYEWISITYGEVNKSGLFVAVAQGFSPANGPGDIMTSPNGVNWTLQQRATNNYWSSITYGTPNDSGLFVVVGWGGSDNNYRVMTSSDGITWTKRACPAQNWAAVTYGTPGGSGLFVAVGNAGNNRIMTSPDGIMWTARTAPALNNWASVIFANNLFVAVANSGIGNRVMTSPDGINWTIRSSPADIVWRSVTYGQGMYVAVSENNYPNDVMTSPDGINWTLRTKPIQVGYLVSVTFGIYEGSPLFVAVAHNGSYRIMTSPDGITWTAVMAPEYNAWISVTFGKLLFVAVAYAGSNYRVMTAGDTSLVKPTIRELPSSDLTFDNYMYSLNSNNITIANSNYNLYVPKSFASAVFHQDKKTMSLFKYNSSLQNTDVQLVFGDDFSGNLTLISGNCTSGNIFTNLTGQILTLFINGKTYRRLVNKNSSITYIISETAKANAYGTYSATISDITCGTYTIISPQFEFTADYDNIEIYKDGMTGIIIIPFTQDCTVIQSKAVSISSNITYTYKIVLENIE